MKNLLQYECLLKLKLQFFADNGNTGQTEQNENGENAEPGDNTETNLIPEQQKLVDDKVNEEMQRKKTAS